MPLSEFDFSGEICRMRWTQSHDETQTALDQGSPLNRLVELHKHQTTYCKSPKEHGSPVIQGAHRHLKH